MPPRSPSISRAKPRMSITTSRSTGSSSRATGSAPSPGTWASSACGCCQAQATASPSSSPCVASIPSNAGSSASCRATRKSTRSCRPSMPSRRCSTVTASSSSSDHCRRPGCPPASSSSISIISSASTTIGATTTVTACCRPWARSCARTHATPTASAVGAAKSLFSYVPAPACRRLRTLPRSCASASCRPTSFPTTRLPSPRASVWPRRGPTAASMKSSARRTRRCTWPRTAAATVWSRPATTRCTRSRGRAKAPGR